MATQLYAGFAYNNVGDAIVGATVNLYDRNTTTPVRATTTTDANGYWTISHATEGRFDVEIVSGTTKRRRKYDDSVQLETIEAAVFRLRNPADTFDIEIAPGAVTADRTVTIPVVTANDTFAVLGLAQTFTARQLWAKGADIASAATITPGTDGNYFDITGVTGITAIATLAAGSIVIFQFAGALPITHNATTLILQGAVNLTTATGDVIGFISEGGGNWRELFRRLAAAAATQAVRGYCRITDTGVLRSNSFNVTSVTDTGPGDRTIVWGTDFTNTNYAVLATLGQASALFVDSDTWATGSVRHVIYTSGIVFTDAETSVSAFGDQ